MIKSLLILTLTTLSLFSYQGYAEDSHEHEDDHHDEADHADEDSGFKISAEAEKNFEIKKMKVPKESSFEIPKSALVTTGLEINIYRFRDGYFKRIDFTFVSKKEKSSLIKSSDLQWGDEIVIAGTGLLRIAEIAAFGGAPEGHSH